MREHALPQDVTGYKFHIIGNMTLKQFGEVAAGCIAGFVLYQTNLPVPIKWPLIVIFAGFGALVAFVPVEERPLDQWLVAFFHALYRPTQYYWKRTPKVPEPFLYEPKVTTKSVVGEVDLTPARRNRVKEYLRSIEQVAQPDEFEAQTAQQMDSIMSIFGGSTQLSNANQPASFAEGTPFTEETTETLSFAGRASGEETNLANTVPEIIPNPQLLNSQTILELFNDPVEPIRPVLAQTQPAITVTPVEELNVVEPSAMNMGSIPIRTIEPTASRLVLEIPEIELSDISTPDTSPEPIATLFAPAPAELVPSVSIQSKNQPTQVAENVGPSLQVHVVSEVLNAQLPRSGPGKIQFKPTRQTIAQRDEATLPQILDMTQVQGDASQKNTSISAEPTLEDTHQVVVPELREIQVNKTKALLSSAPVIFGSTNSEMENAVDPSLLDRISPLERITGLKNVTFNPDLPFPDKPTVPNKVVGMVVDTKGQAVPNAIVEILTPSGMPARAVKTNPLGQFFITTPLNNGEYIIKAEKDQLDFSAMQLVINNTVLPPLEVKANEVSELS